MSSEESSENNDGDEDDDNDDGVVQGDFLWSCSFEDDASGAGTWCDTTNDVDDDFDWTLSKDPTPSNPTGPDAAHSGQYYVFIEATNRQQDDKAV